MRGAGFPGGSDGEGDGREGGSRRGASLMRGSDKESHVSRQRPRRQRGEVEGSFPAHTRAHAHTRSRLEGARGMEIDRFHNDLSSSQNKRFAFEKSLPLSLGASLQRHRDPALAQGGQKASGSAAPLEPKLSLSRRRRRKRFISGRNDPHKAKAPLLSLVLLGKPVFLRS